MARGAFYCSLLSELKADQDMATALMALKAIEPLCQSPALAVALLGHDWGFWSALLQHLQSHRNHATALSEVGRAEGGGVGGGGGADRVATVCSQGMKPGTFTDTGSKGPR